MIAFTDGRSTVDSGAVFGTLQTLIAEDRVTVYAFSLMDCLDNTELKHLTADKYWHLGMGSVRNLFLVRM